MPDLTARSALKRAFDAVWNGDAETIRSIVDFNGLDVNAVDSEGATLLMRAASRNQAGLVSALLRDPRINVWIADKSGRTAFAHTFDNLKSNR